MFWIDEMSIADFKDLISYVHKWRSLIISWSAIVFQTSSILNESIPNESTETSIVSDISSPIFFSAASVIGRNSI